MLLLALQSVLAFGRGKGGSMGLQVTSTAFSPGETIPKKFTCDGPDVSPQLAWNETPVGTESFALIADDPDAPGGTWVHWVLYDLPASVRMLPEGVAKQEQLPSGARQGRNDFGKIGYGGPCPPPGKPHRYFFKPYALARYKAESQNRRDQSRRRTRPERPYPRASRIDGPLWPIVTLTTI